MKSRLFVLIVGWGLTGYAGAHHSFAMFDHDKEITIDGIITKFEWTNPHTFIFLVTKDSATGQDIEWAIESSSPNTLKRRGWSRKSLSPGDKVSLTLNPLRSGGAGGSLVKVAVAGQPGPPLF